jgi:hypothetical protein
MILVTSITERLSFRVAASAVEVCLALYQVYFDRFLLVAFGFKTGRKLSTVSDVRKVFLLLIFPFWLSGLLVSLLFDHDKLMFNNHYLFQLF